MNGGFSRTSPEAFAPPGAGPSAVLWERLDRPAFELARLREGPEGFRLAGTVLTTVDGVPAELRYEVRGGPTWETRTTRVELLRDGSGDVAPPGTGVRDEGSRDAGVRAEGSRQVLELRRDDEGRWWGNGKRLDGLDGAADVDLGFTPATNTLPIRRLSLKVGEAADLRAAWVRFPSLRVEPLPQRYSRLAGRRYRYESRGGAFVADLQVDARGLVIGYGDLWRRVSGRGRWGGDEGPAVEARPPEAPGVAAAERGIGAYHHIGIPTDRVRPGERHLPELGMHVSGYESSPYGIEWMRFDPDSPLPELVRTVPHVAFEVDDLEAALEGKEVLIEPNSPSEGIRVAFIVYDGAPVELLERTRARDAPEPPE